MGVKINRKILCCWLIAITALLTLSAIVLLFAARAEVWGTAPFMIAMLALVALTTCLLVQIGIYHRFYRRLESLLHATQDSEPELRNRPPKHWDESELLGRFERCLAESNSAGALRTEAELHALQNQINPHFLYNTLEIVRSRALTQGNQDVAEMAESLALQFRYCINRQGELATLQQEIDHVHNYLLIQRYRFGDRIRYQQIIHDPTGQAKLSRIPMLTLQPIIENALLHGINPRVEGGTITLRIRTSERRILISVDDDGVGIPEKDLKRIRSTLQDGRTVPIPSVQEKHSTGIAIYNVNQRIRLYFGETYGLDIFSTEGVGTSVVITLPLVYVD